MFLPFSATMGNISYFQRKLCQDKEKLSTDDMPTPCSLWANLDAYLPEIKFCSRGRKIRSRIIMFPPCDCQGYVAIWIGCRGSDIHTVYVKAFLNEINIFSRLKSSIIPLKPKQMRTWIEQKAVLCQVTRCFSSFYPKEHPCLHWDTCLSCLVGWN